MTHIYKIKKNTIQELLDAIDLYKKTIDFFNSRKDENSKIKYQFTIKQINPEVWISKFKVHYDAKEKLS